MAVESDENDSSHSNGSQGSELPLSSNELASELLYSQRKLIQTVNETLNRLIAQQDRVIDFIIGHVTVEEEEHPSEQEREAAPISGNDSRGRTIARG